MEDLIKALQIFLKYKKEGEEWRRPTHCEHDELTVDLSPSLVSEEDKKTLDELGFFVDEESDDFKSFRFGSC